MSCTRSQFIAQLQGWVGLKESNGSHKKIIDIYNTLDPLPVGYKLRYSDAWCAGTASAAAVVCDAVDIIPVECSVPRMVDKAQEMGIWVEADDHVPLPGDLCVYDWDDNGKGDNKGGEDHVGAVEECDGETFVVIEGNYQNAVKRRTMEVNGRYIRGFICPKFDAQSQEETPMKKIYVNPGHSDTDPGAVGYEVERELAVKVSNYQREHLLENYECEVRMNPGTLDKLQAIAADANNWGADLFCSNHFNAGQGDGYEALVHNEKRRQLGEIFEKHVKAAGQNSRGVKLRPNLAVLRLTNMPAILNEGAFVDNRSDIEDWNDDAELKMLGIAYAEACAEFLELPKKAPEPERETVSVLLPVLRRGDESPAVEALQTLLNGRKCPCGTADGEFGPATEKAVKTFQEKNNLPVTGVVDGDTWQAIWTD